MTSPAPLLPHLSATAPVALAARAKWLGQAPSFGAKHGVESSHLEAWFDRALLALAAWAGAEAAGRQGRPALARWLAAVRQEASWEGALAGVVALERSFGAALWEAGLAAPQWRAAATALEVAFGAWIEEAAGALAPLLGQHAALREGLGHLHRLATVLEAGLDVGAWLPPAVREAARLLRCEFAAVLLPQEGAPEVLAIKAVVAPGVVARALEGMPFPLDENGLLAQVFITGAPASSHAPLDDLEVTIRRRQTLESLGFTQLQAFPLVALGRVVGVLAIANRLDDAPWQAHEEEWAATLAAHLALALRLGSLEGKADAAFAGVEAGWLAFLAQKDPGLAAQGQAVGRLAEALGLALGLSPQRQALLRRAGLLHDLGWLTVSDAQRLRSGAQRGASPEALATVAEAGASVLEGFHSLGELVPAVRHQQERFDGSGKPGGLKGEGIPLEARILAVAKAYVEAVAPIRGEAVLDAEAVAVNLAQGAGSAYDPLVVQALAEVPQEALPGQGPSLWALPSESPPEPPPDAPEAKAVRLAWLPDKPLQAPSGPQAPSAQAQSLLALLGDLQAAPNLEDLHARFWAGLKAVLPVAAGALWRPAGVARFDVAQAWGWNAFPGARRVPESGLETYASACQVAVAVADLGQDQRFRPAEAMATEGFDATVAIPLSAGDRPWGVLSLYRRGGPAFGPEELATAEFAAALLAAAGEGLELREQVSAGAMMDPLTGLASGRAFAERLGAELQRVGRYGLPLSVAWWDLDGFEAFNEAHGLALGDEALRQVAAIAQGQVRPGELLARVGADAFAWLMPEVGMGEGLARADALRVALGQATFAGRTAGGARLTACVGITARTGEASTRRSVLEDLRKALAKAQAEGPDRLQALVGSARAEEA